LVPAKLLEVISVKRIQVLGAGCPTCEKLQRNAEAAVHELGIAATVEKISDMGAIIALGALMTPALAIDGEVKVVGKVPSPEEIKKLLGASRENA
jgi:small redox-active disulfide protein 2